MCLCVKMWFILKRECKSVAQLSTDSATPWTVVFHAPLHGILQVRTLEWVAIPFSRDSSQTRDQTQISHIAGRFFPVWTTYWITVYQSFPWWFCLLLLCDILQLAVCVCVFSFLLQHPGPWLYQMHFFFILLLTFSGAPFINRLSENNCNI